MLEFLAVLMDSLDVQRLALVLLGLVIFAHLICTANFMPLGSSCAVWLPVACGVTCSVLVLHSAVYGELQRGLWCAAASAASLVLMQIALWAKGYHVSAHLRVINSLKTGASV